MRDRLYVYFSKHYCFRCRIVCRPGEMHLPGLCSECADDLVCEMVLGLPGFSISGKREDVVKT